MRVADLCDLFLKRRHHMANPRKASYCQPFRFRRRLHIASLRSFVFLREWNIAVKYSATRLTRHGLIQKENQFGLQQHQANKLMQHI